MLQLLKQSRIALLLLLLLLLEFGCGVRHEEGTEIGRRWRCGRSVSRVVVIVVIDVVVATKLLRPGGSGSSSRRMRGISTRGGSGHPNAFGHCVVVELDAILIEGSGRQVLKEQLLLLLLLVTDER